MSIRATTWNEWAGTVRKARLVAGREVRIVRGREGQTISAERGTAWKHPWTISPEWSAAQGAWRAAVRAGFVNGAAPVMQVAAAEAPAPTLARLAQTGAPRQAPAGRVGAPLYDEPRLALNWLPLGVDGVQGDAVPKFFQDRGVGLAKAIDPDNPESAGQVTAPPGNRLLRKCDVVLHQPRTGLASQVTTGDGLSTGLATTTVTLTPAPIDPTDALRVYAISKWMPPQAELDLETLTYNEPSYDETAIGTVYLLSPPDAAPYSAPDQTWQPHVQHALFWNLAYAQPQFVPAATDIGNPLLVPLGGGVAQAIINSFTSEIDDALGQAAEFLAAQSMRGSFWAPTGGGSDSGFPAAAPGAAAGSTGLDKGGRLAAQRAQAQNDRLTERLDPIFPYKAPAFNLALLT